ncbi:MAG: DUF523 domain-containing protein [Gammaproteobacteria bacterium]|nr:DUF523 domain-containing protein [Gammaproteobacteria bacterium]
MVTKAKIGVSRCLLGDAVRYDGQSKPCALVIDKLGEQFELIAICPEVEAGLSIPRPPVQLSGSLENPLLTGRDDPCIDVTELIHNYCLKKIPSLNELSGFVLKSRSPSCGLNSTPVFINGKCVTETSSGVFARALQAAYPNLPIVEETQIELSKTLNDFIQAASQDKMKGLV